MSNAIKFVEESIGTINITAQEKEETVAIMIKDNGKGVLKEDRRYIFDKFYQSKNQNIKKPAGSGFGLAISKQIVERHNGTIWLDETHKKGACFVIELPK